MIELGELRAQMEKGEAASLESIIDQNFNKTSYYIWKHSNWEGHTSNVMRTKYTLITTKPRIPIIGTKLWLVDNERGVLTLEWDLPMDIINADVCSSNEIIGNNFSSAVQYGGAIWNA